jgi:hypothetical protein
METPPLNLDYFYGLDTELGWKVGDFQPINGHHLVYKIPLGETFAGSRIILPPEVQRKATRNVTMIRGFVLKTSGPWHRKRPLKRIVWDNEGDCWKVDWTILEAKDPLETDIPLGCCALYTSYNMGRIKVRGLGDPLVVVREIDIDAIFDPKEIERVALGAKAMT